jgi:type IV pilus assembly protein PilV
MSGLASCAGQRSANASGNKRTRFGATERGVGLIEVLVAVLILSIAFLGIAALQVMSLSTNNSAMARSMATISSYSILDAMRADTVNAQTGAYNTAAPIKASACPDAGGTLATKQINQWCQQLAANLGAVATTTGQITCTTNATAKTTDCTVTIAFDDSRGRTGESNVQQIVTRAIL